MRFTAGSLTIWVLILATAAPTAAQQPTAAEAAATPATTVLGFADVDFVESERVLDEGFVLGQFVGHVTSSLSERLTFFGEVSATARPREYQIEVERLILRYDFTDHFKLSGGRYHTPINYWNTAFHHGLWLQTTVARPQMIKFGSQLLPVHFVGLQAEGSFPLAQLGPGYAAGIGNGRSENIARAGDAGDVNQNRAVLGTVYVRPPGVFGLQLGAAAYLDRVSVADGREADERILSAHAVLARESPEILAEYARISHESVGGGETTDSDAWYIQLAYRLADPVEKLKPYARVERIQVPADDSLFAQRNLEYSGFLAGVRYDFSSLAAFKVEYRSDRFGDEDFQRSLWAQVAFVFGV